MGDNAHGIVAIGMAVVGFISLVIGIALLAWRAAQKQVIAGAAPSKISQWTALLKAIGSLVEKIAKAFPNEAARIGIVLIVLGVLLIAMSLRV